jgi:hypothetical protein
VKAGIYQHKKVPDQDYLLLGLARQHETGDEFVAYVPLWVKAEWSGTARIGLRIRDDWEANFTWAGERLPGEKQADGDQC